MADIVGTEFVEDTADCKRICHEFCGMSHASRIVDCVKLAGVEESIPVGKVDDRLFDRRPLKLELSKASTATNVVIIFIYLAKSVTVFHVFFIVFQPMLFGASNREATVLAIVGDMCRRESTGDWLP